MKIVSRTLIFLGILLGMMPLNGQTRIWRLRETQYAKAWFLIPVRMDSAVVIGGTTADSMLTVVGGQSVTGGMTIGGDLSVSGTISGSFSSLGLTGTADPLLTLTNTNGLLNTYIDFINTGDNTFPWSLGRKNDGQFVVYDEEGGTAPISIEPDTYDNILYLDDTGKLVVRGTTPDSTVTINGGFSATGGGTVGGDLTVTGTITGTVDHGGLSGLSDDDHTQYGALAQDETISGNWVNTANPWVDGEVANDLTIATTSALSVTANADPLVTLTNSNAAGNTFIDLRNTGDNTYPWSVGRWNDGNFVVYDDEGGTKPLLIEPDTYDNLLYLDSDRAVVVNGTTYDSTLTVMGGISSTGGVKIAGNLVVTGTITGGGGGSYLFSADFGDSLANYDGDGLVITNNDAIDVLVDYDGGIEISDDSLNIKINGSELATTSSGLAIASSITRDNEWDTASEINAATTDDDFVQDGDIGSTVQAYDADLSALAGLSSTGMVVRTGSGTATVRTITGDAEIVVADGSGVSGNPTLSIASSITRDSELSSYLTRVDFGDSLVAYDGWGLTVTNNDDIEVDTSQVATLTALNDTASAHWTAITSGTSHDHDATYLNESSNLSDLDNATTARTNLGVAIGSDVQAWDAQLDDLADGTITGNFINTANPWADNEVANDITLTNITQITNRSHTNLTDIGTNTHPQIDTHIADTGNPHSTDHGALGGLGDDDHTQYGALAQDETVSGSWTFSNTTKLDATLSHTGDANTYLSFTPDVVTLQAGGDQFVIDGGNNKMYSTSLSLGIGTASPGAELEVAGNVFVYNTDPVVVIGDDASNKLRIDWDTSSDYGLIETVVSGGYSGDLVLQPTGGNVVIGKTSASGLLHVYESSGNQNSYFDSYDNNSTIYLRSGLDGAIEESTIYFADSTTNKWAITKDTGNDLRIYDYTGTQTVMEFFDNGNIELTPAGSYVVIEKSDSDAFLHINSTTDGAYLYLDSNKDGAGTSQNQIHFQDNNSNIWYLAKTTSNNFLLYDDVANSNALLFNSNGNATISPAGGTTNVTGDLVVTGTITGTIASAGGWTDDGTVVRLSTGTDSVGIGTTSPTQPLTVNGKAQIGSSLIQMNTGDVNVVHDIYNSSVLKAISGYSLAGDYYGIGHAESGIGNIGNAQLVVKEGNLGIGTTSPSGMLHVYESSGALSSYFDANTDNSYIFIRSALDGAEGEDSGIVLADSATNKWGIVKNTNNDFGIYDYTGTQYALSIVDNGDMTLSPAGGEVYVNAELGIGQNTPKGPLDVYKASGDLNTYFDGNTDNSYIWIRSGLDGESAEVSGIVFSDSSTSMWRIVKGSGNNFTIYDYTGGQNVFDIAENGDMTLSPAGGTTNVTGNMTLSATNPTLTLDASTGDALINIDRGDTGDTAGLRFLTGGANNWLMRTADATNDLFLYNYSTASNVLTVDYGTGDVGFGTASPIDVITVDGGSDVNLNIGTLGSVMAVYGTNDANSAYVPVRLEGSYTYINSYTGGPVGFGTTSVDGDYEFYELSGATEMYVTSETDDAYLYLDSNEDGAGKENSFVLFQDNSTNMWYLGKNTSDDFIIYDDVANSTVMTIADNGDMTLAPAGGDVNVTGQLNVTGSGFGDLYVNSETDDARIWINSGDDGAGVEGSLVIFQDDDDSMWYIGKYTDNSFNLYDYEATANAFSFASNGNATISPAGGTTNVTGDLAVTGTITGTIASAGGWTDGGTDVYLTTLTDQVGIGTASPSQALDLIGSLELEATTTSTTGVIYKGAAQFIHNFQHPTGGGAIPVGRNVFLGGYSGNFTMGSTATETYHASYNVGIGEYAADALTTGYSNTGVGYTALSATTTGSNNVAIGANAMDQNTTGSQNIAIGYSALGGVNTSSYNIAIGYNAMLVNTSGTNNTAVGHFALDANTTAGSNTAIGYTALGSNTEGHNNTALGINALAANTTGDYNIGIGSGALDGNTTADNNLAIGYAALGAANTGTQNIAFGNYVLDANTSGGYNVGIGGIALGQNTEGTYNVGIGYGALQGSLTGNSSVAVGYAALYNNTTSNNTAIGYASMYLNTSGSGNVSVGYGSLDANVTGSNNTVVGYNGLTLSTSANNTGLGYNVLATLTSGTGHTAVGYAAGDAVTTNNYTTAIGYNALTANTAANNTAVGAMALDANTSGARNTAVGYGSSGTVVTGTDNTAMGYNALSGSTGGQNTAIGSYALDSQSSGEDNTAVGYAAGDQVSTGDNNILIGFAAGDAITTGSNNIVIGYNIDAPSATASNQMSIGNLIFATGVDGTGTTVSSGNVGIGKTDPDGLLHVYESSGVQSSYFDSYNNNSWIYLRSGLDGGAEYSGVILADSAVGKWRLQMDTNEDFGIYDNTATQKALTIVGNGDMTLSPAGADVNVTGDLNVSNDITLTDDNWIGISGSDEYIQFDATGNDIQVMGSDVGIGTLSPLGMLHVYDASGNQTSYFDANTDNSYLYIRSGMDGSEAEESIIVFSDSATAKWQVKKDASHNFEIYDQTGTATAFQIVPNGDMTLAPAGGTTNVTGDLVVTGSITGGSGAGGWTVSGDVVYTTSTDDSVGIGTNDPVQRLDVVGAVAVDHDLFMSTLTNYNILWSNNASGGLQVYNAAGSSPLVTVLDGGNVGIGTTGPTTALQVESTGAPQVLLTESGNNAPVSLQIGSSNADDVWTTYQTDSYSWSTGIDRSNGHAFALAVNDSLTSDYMMVVDLAGDVGIHGETVPYSALHIASIERTTDPGNLDSLSLYLEGGGWAGDLVGIGFGYSSLSTHYAPVFIGEKVVSGSGHTSGDFVIATRSSTDGTVAPTVRVTVEDDGDVGIGTTAPVNQLHVSNSASSATYARFTNSTTGETAGDGLIVGLGDGDENAYFWHYENEYLYFGTNDTQMMHITSSNIVINETGVDADFRVESNGNANMLFVDGGNDRVGIGTGSPIETFHVVESTAATNSIVSVSKFEATSSGNIADGFGPRIQFMVDDGGMSASVAGGIGGIRDGSDTEGALAFYAGTSGVEEFMRIDNDGNVGIGATSPSAELEVSAGTPNIRITSESNDAIGTLEFYETTAGDISGKIYTSDNGGNDYMTIARGSGTVENISLWNGFMTFTTNSTEKMEIGTSVLVINDPSADYDVRIESNSYSHAFYVDGGNNRIGFNEDTPMAIHHMVGPDGSAGTASFYTDAVLALQNDGSTTDQAYLHILSGNAAVAGIIFGDDDDEDVAWIAYDNVNNDLSFRTNGTSDRVVIASDGNVGIGVTDPDSTLEINGSLHVGTNTLIDGDLTVTGDFTDSKWAENGVYIYPVDVGDKLIMGGTSGNGILTTYGQVAGAETHLEMYAEDLGLVATIVEDINDNGLLYLYDATGNTDVILSTVNTIASVLGTGVRVGDASEATAGVIEWDGSNFRGYDGASWVNLDEQGTSGGGTTDDGDVVRLTSAADSMGIGTTSPTEKLDVTGNINATGTLTLGSALVVAEGGTGLSSFGGGGQILTVNATSDALIWETKALTPSGSTSRYALNEEWETIFGYAGDYTHADAHLSVVRESSDVDNDAEIGMFTHSNTSGHNPILKMYHFGGSIASESSTSNGYVLGEIEVGGWNSEAAAMASATAVRFTAVGEWGNGDATNNGFDIQFHTANQNESQMYRRMSIGSDGAGAVEINPNEYDQNFSVSSADSGDVIFVDAGNNKVGFFTTAPDSGVTINHSLHVTGDIVVDGSGLGSGGWELSGDTVRVADTGDQVVIGADTPLSTAGLTLNSDKMLFNNNAEISHSHTGYLPATSYGGIYIGHATVGGMEITAVSETQVMVPLVLKGLYGNDAGAAYPSIEFRGGEYDGSPGDRDTDDVLFSFANATGSYQYVSVLGDGRIGASEGIIIGSLTDSDTKWIDDATHGSGSATLYIGNETIDTTVPSDSSLKMNVYNTKYGLDIINALRPVDFEFTYAPDVEETGLIAQEVERVYPKAVTTRSDGKLSVDYKEMIPVLIQGMKEQQEQIEVLKKRITELEEK